MGLQLGRGAATLIGTDWSATKCTGTKSPAASGYSHTVPGKASAVPSERGPCPPDEWPEEKSRRRREGLVRLVDALIPLPSADDYLVGGAANAQPTLRSPQEKKPEFAHHCKQQHNTRTAIPWAFPALPSASHSIARHLKRVYHGLQIRVSFGSSALTRKLVFPLVQAHLPSGMRGSTAGL